jgi:alternate signal-mediated exported protein
MEKKMKLKTKPLIFIFALLIITIVGITFAYYTSKAILANKFNTSTYNVTIEEEFYDDWGTKKVFLANNEETNTPVVLRINYNEKWTKEISDLGPIPLSNKVNGSNVVNKEWTEAFLQDFQLHTDGWYYYKKVLKPEEKVQVLNSITLNESLIQSSPYYEDYLTADYNLSFNFEAIQATEEAVNEIWQHEITIESSEVKWPF